MVAGTSAELCRAAIAATGAGHAEAAAAAVCDGVEVGVGSDDGMGRSDAAVPDEVAELVSMGTLKLERGAG